MINLNWAFPSEFGSQNCGPLIPWNIKNGQKEITPPFTEYKFYIVLILGFGLSDKAPNSEKILWLCIVLTCGGRVVGWVR